MAQANKLLVMCLSNQSVKAERMVKHVCSEMRKQENETFQFVIVDCRSSNVFNERFGLNSVYPVFLMYV